MIDKKLTGKMKAKLFFKYWNIDILSYSICDLL